MSFLSCLGNFVQNVGPTAGAVAEAQAQGSAQRNQQALQIIPLQRQQRQAEVDNVLHLAQSVEAQQHGTLYGREAAKPQLGDPGYAQAMGDVAGTEALA